MGYTRKQGSRLRKSTQKHRRATKLKRSHNYAIVQAGGKPDISRIRDVVVEMRDLLKTPDYKYIWKNNAKYEKLKKELLRFNINAVDSNEYDKKRHLDLLQEMRNLEWSHLTDDQKKELRALITYEQKPVRNIVYNMHGNPMNDLTIENRIRKILERQEPLKEELIVWRGHNEGPKQILPISWFSTSTLREIASEYKYGCCIFKIHLQPGVKVLDMYKVYKEYGIQTPVKDRKWLESLLNTRISVNYEKFGEIIVEEGGTFYKNKERTEPGFRAINSKNTEFETYYFPKAANYIPREGNWSEELFFDAWNNQDQASNNNEY